jgi:hypothetical protein
MSLATTRPPMRSTPTSEPLTWIQTTLTFRHGCNFCRTVAPPTECPTRIALLYPKTSIHKHISLRLRMVHPVRSGVSRKHLLAHPQALITIAPALPRSIRPHRVRHRNFNPLSTESRDDTKLHYPTLRVLQAQSRSLHDTSKSRLVLPPLVTKGERHLQGRSLMAHSHLSIFYLHHRQRSKLVAQQHSRSRGGSRTRTMGHSQHPSLHHHRCPLLAVLLHMVAQPHQRCDRLTLTARRLLALFTRLSRTILMCQHHRRLKVVLARLKLP